jgi:ATP-dependent protease ClpP protease subunit
MKNYIRVDSRIRCKTADLDVQAPAIRVSKVFDYEMVERFSCDFNNALNKNPPVIPIVIDSYGGEVYCLLEMISLIKSAPVPVATICNGKAMSCGAMLFMFGTNGYRFMSEQATLMLHEVSSGSYGKVEEVKANAEETNRLNNMLFGMAAKHIGVDEKYFLNLLHKHNHAEIYMDAKQAKIHKIANHIGVPELITEVSVSHKFLINNKELKIK